MSKVQEKGNLFIQILFRKKADVSEAEFHEHWSTYHAGIAVETLLEYGIVGYTQYHCPKAIRSLIEKAAEIQSSQLFSSTTLLDFDGVVMLTVKDINDVFSFFEGPVYRTVIAQDELTFVDFKNSEITCGYLEDKIVGGKIVDGLEVIRL